MTMNYTVDVEIDFDEIFDDVLEAINTNQIEPFQRTQLMLALMVNEEQEKDESIVEIKANTLRTKMELEKIKEEYENKY